MEGNIERDCSALGALFQQVITDLKNGTPLWEDLISKATKLHSCLKATILAVSAYLDAFQRIADSATNTKGATKEIGTALTRICLRHKAVEARVKTFTSAIMDCLVTPLQEKLEDWKKSVINLDKEHTKEYKRARAELKKKSTDTLRLQKKAARKGGSMATIGNSSGPVGVVGTGPVAGGPDLQHQLDVSLADVHERRHLLEEAEHKAACAALVEERSRYCIFVACLKPVVDEEVAMLGELTHLQEVLAQLEKHTTDPYSLPQASEQVIQEIRNGRNISTTVTNCNWSLHTTITSSGAPTTGSHLVHHHHHHHGVGGRGHRGTPPSSPSSSLGSRKSSMCSSISSLNSSSSGSLRSHPSPSHHYWHRSLSQPPMTVTGVFSSSTSSGDSGFVSQDLFPPYYPYHTNQLSIWQAGISPPLVPSMHKKVSPERSADSGSSDGSTPVPPRSCSSREAEDASSPDGGENCTTPPAVTPETQSTTNPTLTTSTTSAATWPNLQETRQFELSTNVISGDRPHTISSAYERGHQRPPLTVYTFRPPSASSSLDITLTPGSASQPASPSGVNIDIVSSSKESSQAGSEGASLLQFTNRPPIPQRCSSLERPKLPSRDKPSDAATASKSQEHYRKCDGVMNENKEAKALTADDVPLAHHSVKGIQGHQQPLYVNMNELATLAAKKALASKQNDSPLNLSPPPPPPPPSHHHTGSSSTPAARSLPPPPPPHAFGVIEKYNLKTENDQGESQPEISRNISEKISGSASAASSYSPPEEHYSHIIPQNLLHSTNPFAEGNSTSAGRGTLLRRASTQGPKPPPPIRRTSSISSTGGVAGGLAQLRSQCSPPVPQHYSQGLEDLSGSAPPSPLPPPPPPLSRDVCGDTRNSLENLPPPPAFLLDTSEGFVQSYQKSIRSEFDRFKDEKGVPTPIPLTTPVPVPSTVSVADAVRSLTEINHQPASPGSVRRGTAVPAPGGNHVSNKAEKDPGGKVLSGSPTRSNLIQLQQQQQHTALQKAARVRQWISSRSLPDPTVCHDSLMDQIRRGAPLRRTRGVVAASECPMPQLRIDN